MTFAMPKPCPFCTWKAEILTTNEHAFAIYDAFPVSAGHVLAIPKRHVATIFELKPTEYAACFELIRELKPRLEGCFGAKAFNIGVNCGEIAGQTVAHAHIHLIPRYAGDVPDPRGGVRHVIPGKGRY